MTWISVEQELPARSDSTMRPKEHRVLLVMNGRYVHQGTCYAYSDSVEWRVPHVCGSINDLVTHWMPEPEPPAPAEAMTLDEHKLGGMGNEANTLGSSIRQRSGDEESR